MERDPKKWKSREKAELGGCTWRNGACNSATEACDDAGNAMWCAIPRCFYVQGRARPQQRIACKDLRDVTTISQGTVGFLARSMVAGLVSERDRCLLPTKGEVWLLWDPSLHQVPSLPLGSLRTKFLDLLTMSILS